MPALYFSAALLLVATAFLLGRSRAIAVSAGNSRALHSRPVYHALLAATATAIPLIAVYLLGIGAVERLAQSRALAIIPADSISDAFRASAVLRDIQNVASGNHAGEVSSVLRQAADVYGATRSLGLWTVAGVGLAGALLAGLLSLRSVAPRFRARTWFERLVSVALALCAMIAVLTTIGIVLSVLVETYRFFFDPSLKGRPTVAQFLFGTEWNPQAALRADQGDIKTAFGFIPLLTGTLLITSIAILVAGPLGLLSAIYLSEYASPRLRAWAKPVLEILAGIPTVVLGFFAALTVAPLIRAMGERFGLDVASESALAAGLVMGMMIVPFVSSLSDDVINAVPQSLRDGAAALGATKSETIRQVALPAALSGIVSAFMLAISRAIGETMIVVMAAGLAANLTLNPLDAVTTITVQIKTILVGDQEFDSAKTLAAFALGLVLFFVTLMLNLIAQFVSRKFREQYD